MPSPHPRRPAPRPLLALLPAALAGAGYDKIATFGGTTGPGQSAEALGSVNSGGYAPPGRGPGGASSKGVVTASFLWVRDSPQDDPPPAVVVKKTASANASGDSPAAADGLGHAPYDMGTTRFSAGGAYEVKGGESFEVTVKPSASASDDQGGACGVSVIVSCTPVRIELSGGLCPQKKELLVGQKLTAGVVGAPSSPWNTYQWSISGVESSIGLPTGGDGAPFTSWSVAGDPPLPTYDGYFRVDLPSMSCNFRRPDLVKIKCSVTLDGIGSFTVEDKVSVILPEYPDEEYDRGVMGIYDHSAPGPYYDSRPLLGGNWLEINGAELFYPDTGRFGIWWRCRLKTPTPYVQRYGSYGGWNYTQRIEGWSAHASDEAFTYSMPSMNGHNGLDGSYPYLSRGTPSQIPWAADGSTLRYFEDRPGSSIDWAISCSLGNSFSTYIMYRPPGSGSQFVPIHKLEWHSAGTATLLGGTVWALSGADEGDSGIYYNRDPHPMWTEVLTPEWSQD